MGLGDSAGLGLDDGEVQVVGDVVIRLANTLRDADCYEGWKVLQPRFHGDFLCSRSHFGAHSQLAKGGGVDWLKEST